MRRLRLSASHKERDGRDVTELGLLLRSVMYLDTTTSTKLDLARLERLQPPRSRAPNRHTDVATVSTTRRYLALNPT